MANAYAVSGTLTDSTTLKLDEPLPIDPVKIRVMIEPVAPSPKRSVVEFVDEIWAQQKAEGRVPPTQEEVNEYLREERASWGDSE